MQGQSHRHRHGETKTQLAKLLLSFAVLLVLCQSVYASDASLKEIKTLSLKSEFGTKSDWHVTAWQPIGNESGMGEVSARLCFWTRPADRKERCTAITSSRPNDGLVYHYQSVQELEVVHPDTSNPSGSLLKFDARFSGGGSGWLDQVSFWRYDSKTDAFEPSSHVSLTEQGEYHLFGEGELQGMLVTADAISQADETHFAPHHFYVEAYRYADGGFVKVLGYLTASKYHSLDDTDKIDVVAHEVSRTKKLLLQIEGH